MLLLLHVGTSLSGTSARPFRILHSGESVSTKTPVRNTSTSAAAKGNTWLETMGARALEATAPRLWNALPDHLRVPQTVDTFKKRSQNFSFSQSLSCLIFI